MSNPWRRLGTLALAAATSAALAPAVGAAAPSTTTSSPVPTVSTAGGEVTGPLPGAVPGDPLADELADTYPFFSTPDPLAARGYVEEEFLLSGTADGYAPDGERVATDVDYTTRVVVRRPADERRFNGTALVEWQNVSAGYDLDALWDFDAMTRAGYAWVGVSAQRVGVDHLREWSPTRYGDLDVTGGGAYPGDQLSYDIFAEAGRAVADPRPDSVLGGLDARTVLALGASQSAGRMSVYYDHILPKTEPVFDGYNFAVGTAPSREGDAPVFTVLSETDVRSPRRPADTDRFRRWEVAGAAHSGYRGQRYREPISERDLGAAPEYDCDEPPFSRTPLHHVLAAANHHLVRWVEDGTPPPTAEPLEFTEDGTKRRDELGLAEGGIRLSQHAVPTARNTGHNTGETFCVLFGTHEPFTDDTLDALYPTRGSYLRAVKAVDRHNVREGYLLPADAWSNWRDARHSDVGHRW